MKEFRFAIRRFMRWAAAAGLLVMVLDPARLNGQVPERLPPDLTRDPVAARIVYDDLDAFAATYRRLLATHDTVAILDASYIGQATVGLSTYANLYGVDAEAVASAIARYPERFRRAALEGPVRIRALEPELRTAFARFRSLYPETIFPSVFFFVGRHGAGGAVKREGVFVAVEAYAAPSDDPAAMDFPDYVHLVVHELAHFQQAVYDLERYQRANSLLATAIKEGVADYVAELVSGAHVNPAAHAYGVEHEWALWREFRCHLQETETDDWFFTDPENPDWPQDLGYFIGYRIAAARYARESDPLGALTVIIQVDDYDRFLRESGYETYLERREGREFPACR